jgi:hypothetical protein
METCIERCERLWGFDGTIDGAKAAIDDMNERYYKPMQVAQQQHESDTRDTERLQEVIDGFRLSKR